jgi:DNA-binding MarR family transcriptional regulator
VTIANTDVLPTAGRYHGFVVNATTSWYPRNPKNAMTRPERSISMLFDLFVLNQRVRRLVSAALVDVSLRADEYAVYSLLYEQGPLTATEMVRRMGMPLTTLLDYLKAMEARGHLRRQPHPRDGRAQQLSLTLAGVSEHRRTNRAWEAMIERLGRALPMPEKQIRRALQAFDDAVAACLSEIEEQAAVSRA